MNFFSHTSAWIKGELFEAALITAFGLFTTIIGILFWKIGTTPTAKALLIPMVVAGLIYLILGVSMTISNKLRLPQFEQRYKKSSSEFIHSEKKRVEAFQVGYTISKVVATMFFFATILIFWITKSPGLQAIGIGLTYFGLAGLVVDYFSQERANFYYQAILEAIA